MASKAQGCGGCAVLTMLRCRFSGYTTIFGTSLPSCGFKYDDIYDNYSKARGVGVLCQSLDGWQA